MSKTKPKNIGVKAAPVGSVTNRRFYTVISVIVIKLLVLGALFSLAMYFLGLSQGKTKVELKGKDIEVIELQKDGAIKSEVWRNVPDTSDPHFWDKLRSYESQK